MNPQLQILGTLQFKSIIDSERVESLYKQLKEDSKTWVPDTQCPKSPACHNWAPAVELMHELAEELSITVGTKLLPTYSYTRDYRHGDVLEPHVDRAACEFSVSILLKKDHDWPLVYSHPLGDKKIELEEGDAVLFPGVFNSHWRDGEFQGEEYCAVFLHFVRADGYNSDLEGDPFPFKNTELEGRVRCKIMRNELEQLGFGIPDDAHNPTPLRLEEYIKIFDNVLEPSICNDIIEFYKESRAWEPALVAGDDHNQTTYGSARRCDVLQITEQRDKQSQIIDKQLYHAFEEGLSRYRREVDQCEVNSDEGYFLLRYKTGDYYIQHVDSGTKTPRTLSFVLLLSPPDEYKGGELEMLSCSYKPVLKQGSVIVFPSNFCYTHRVAPVTEGTRYSVVTWMK